MARKRKKSSIKEELRSLVRERIAPEYLEKFGGMVGDSAAGDVSVCRAIAMAQVKKSLDGDLRAAEFIEELITGGGQEEADSPFKVVVKVVGPAETENGA